MTSETFNTKPGADPPERSETAERQQRAIAAEDVLDVIYVGGTGRSGSTVIEHHVADRMQAVVVGETLYLWTRGVQGDQRCGCGRPFSECPFWTAVVTKGRLVEQDAALEALWRRERHRLKSIPHVLLRGHRDATLQAAARAYGEMFHAAATVGGRALVIDSSKEPGFWLFLRLVPGIRVHTLHVVRDSRAVAFSWRRKVLKPEMSHQRAEHMGITASWRAALKWLIVNAIFLTVKGRAHSGCFIRVRYEDFATEPELWIERIKTKLDLRSPNAGVSAVPEHIEPHSVSGNPVRFDPARLARVTLDEEWRRSMPWRSRAVVTILSFPLLVAFGYLPRRN